MDIIIFLGLLSIISIFLFKQSQEYSFDEDPKFFHYLPWGYLVEKGIIFNKNGSFQQTFKIQGQDRKSLEDIDMVDLRARINNAFKRLDGNYSFHIESRRIKAKPYTKVKFKEKVLDLIDNIREKNYNSGDFFITEYFFTITWLPPVDLMNKIQQNLIEDEEKKDKQRGIDFLKEFKSNVRELKSLLKNYFIQFEEMDDTETLTYLHSCYSQNPHKVVPAENKEVFLDAYLSDATITDGLPPKINDEYIGIISLLSMPSESYFSMLSDIEELGMEFRWVSRYIFENKEDSIKKMKKMKEKWASKRKGAMEAAEDKIMKTDRTTNLEADIRQNEATSAQTDLEEDVYVVGYYTFTLICKNKNIDKLNDNLEAAMEIIQNKGFVCVKEFADLLQAFFGSMAGDIQHNVRRVPLPSMIAIDLLQFTSIYSGRKENTHLGGAPHVICNATKGATATYLNLNVGDVGHTAIYGQTGAGKSVLLSFLAAQWKKYKDAQVFFFDKGGSSRVLTAAVGGKFNDLGSSKVKFQPLGNIGVTNEINEEEAEKELNFAFEWICDIYEQENMILTPKLKDNIMYALKSVATLPKERRTITQFSLALQDNDLRLGIKQYTNDGAFGIYFDNNQDTFNRNYTWQVFEMDKILDNRLVARPILSYMFHKLEVEMFVQAKPTLLILDECWRLLDDEKFSQKIKMWLKELRKKRVYVVFATQEITDIINSSIKNTLINSCPTTIYLPNKRAGSEALSPFYRELGLNNKQIEIIASLEPKRDYYVVSSLGNLDIKPNFTDFELAFIGASTQADQNKCIEIQKELEEENLSNEEYEKEFIERWLKHKKIAFPKMA